MYKKLLQWIFGNMPKQVILAFCIVFLVTTLYFFYEISRIAEGLQSSGGLFNDMVKPELEARMIKIVVFFVLFWIFLDGYKLRRFQSSPNPDTHVKCPDCKELVFKEANKCPHCNCKLIPNS